MEEGNLVPHIFKQHGIRCGERGCGYSQTHSIHNRSNIPSVAVSAAKPTKPMLAHDKLHAAVFGRHYHPCPSDWCKGIEQPCSQEYDCQPGPKLCDNCFYCIEQINHPDIEEEVD